MFSTITNTGILTLYVESLMMLYLTWLGNTHRHVEGKGAPRTELYLQNKPHIYADNLSSNMRVVLTDFILLMLIVVNLYRIALIQT